MNNVRLALADYISVLGASADETARAEDRSAYTQHIAAAARMFADLEKGRTEAFLERIAAERRSYGTSFLVGAPGSLAERALRVSRLSDGGQSMRI